MSTLPSRSIGMICVSLMLSCLPALQGCQTKTAPMPPPPAATPPDFNDMWGQWGWEAVSKEGRVPGIDYALVRYGTSQGEIYFAVWSDFNGGSSTEGGPDTGLHVWVDDQAGHKVEVTCRTADGKSGTLVANGQSLDLAHGGLLLVSGGGGKVRIKQLKREGLSAKGAFQGHAPPSIEALKADPEVVAFFSSRDKAEKPK